MMKNLLIVVVTVSYNRVASLKEAFDCIKAQTYKDFTWLIVDDGTEGPRDQFDFLYEDKRVILAHIKHSGVGVARDTSLSLIRANDALVIEYDDHDVMELTCVEHIREAFKYGVDAVYGDHELIDVDDNVVANSFKPDYKENLFREGNFAYGIRAYRLAAARSVGGWRPYEWAAGDYSLFLRMENAGMNFMCIPKKLGQIRIDPESISVKYWPEQIAMATECRAKAIAGTL